MHFDPEYYFGLNTSLDQPYDDSQSLTSSQKTRIELITKMNQIVELSQVSMLIQSINGKQLGDQRLYYPREIIPHILSLAPEELSDNQRIILTAYAEETNDVTYHIQQRLF